MKVIAILLAALLVGAAVVICLLAPGYYASWERWRPPRWSASD